MKILSSILVGFLSLTIIISGCFSQSDERLFICLFDLSGSTFDGKIRHSYLISFQKILNNLKGGDLIICIGMGDNPLTESEIFTLDIKKYNPLSDNPLVHKTRAEADKRKVFTEVDKMLMDKSRAVRNTRILDGLILAQKCCESYKMYRKNFLFIFSDGIEQSQDYDFSRENLTGKRIADIIREQKSHGALPNLKGVKVHLFGSGSGLYRKMDSEKLMRIEGFWTEYLRSAGAIMESAGSPILEFNDLGN